MMSLKTLQSRAQEVLNLYSALGQAEGKTPWNRSELVMGFVGDVGTLVKCTMALDGRQDIENAKAKLEHELADCLWSILIIADKYHINLEESFHNTMNTLEVSINNKIMKSTNKPK